MKISNYIYIGAISMLLAGGLISCEDDLEHYTVDTPEATVLKQSTAAIELSENNLNDIVYTITFPSSSDLTSDVKTDLGNGTYVLEYSLDNSFPKSATVSEVLSAESSNNSISFTGKDLNTIAQKLGATIGKNTTVYFRINHAYNERSTTLGSISNVVELSFTPIKIAATLQAVSKEDASIVYATLVFNEDTQMYEGEYTTNEWNFYLVDPIEGTIYGCDDDWTPAEDCNRSYKLVAGREIGDKYSSWFDPSKRPVIMRVNLNTKTWDWQLIPTDKKDLTGVSILMVGDDLGWNDGWTPSDELPGVVVTQNGDEYTAVFENMELTSTGGFGFRATEPASAWIGKGGISVSDPIIEGTNNLQVSQTGIYTITLKAVAEEDGSVSYSLSAKLTGTASKKDLSDVSIIIVGGDMGWNDPWDQSVAPGIKFTTTDNVNYYAVFENVALTQTFGFRATAPAASWIGGGSFATISDNIAVEAQSGNPYPLESGLYTITVIAIAQNDGSITYKLSAEKTGTLSVQDLTGKEQGIKGAFDASSTDWVIIGKVAPDVNDNVYTYTIANIPLEENQEFGFDGDLNWVGNGGLTVNSDLISEELGNLSVKEAGTYTFVFVATANANGTVSYTLSATKE